MLRLAADRMRISNLESFFDSAALPIGPARADAIGSDGDWVNEIHLIWQSYEKIARPWSRAIEAVIQSN